MNSSELWKLLETAELGEDRERVSELARRSFHTTDYTVREDCAEWPGDYVVDRTLTMGRTLQQRALCVVPGDFWGGYETASRIAKAPSDIAFLCEVIGQLIVRVQSEAADALRLRTVLRDYLGYNGDLHNDIDTSEWDTPEQHPVIRARALINAAGKREGAEAIRTDPFHAGHARAFQAQLPASAWLGKGERP